jgi:histidine triad (HIT) family protein
MDDLFLKIIDREVPANIIYEDEIALAFEDINPQAPTHILVIPKTHIPKLSDAASSQKDILGHLMWATGEIARQLDIEDAYRVVVNNGAKAGQSVFHLHLHILSGRVFSWPPG